MSNSEAGEFVHFAVMMRAWCRLMDERVVWRISVENVRTGERARLGDLPALIEYLERYGKSLVDQDARSEPESDEQAKV